MIVKPTYEELEKQVQTLKTSERALKKAETALRDSEEKYRITFESITDSITVTRIEDGLYLYVNDGFCHQTGYSREEVLGKTPAAINLYAYPAERAQFIKILKQYGKAENVEVSFRRKNGEIYYSEFSAKPISFSSEDCLLAQSKDITIRKHAEKALKASHERFLMVLESIDSTVYVSDMETHEILFMNKYMIDSFGRDMTGETCWKAFRDETKQCSHCTNDQLVDKNGRPTGVYVWQDRNPISGRWYINHDRAIEWNDNHLVRLQIATDITDYKKMEEQVRQAQKMEAIGTLTGGIAHDFNNILSPILGFTEMLQEDLPQDSPEQKSVTEILKAALRAKDLVQQILTFSRQSDQELKPIKIQFILKEALRLLGSTIPATIEIQTDIDPNCGVVIADSTQIHQIIMNLATNAYHAMQKSGGKLKIVLSQAEIESEPLGFSDFIPGRYALLKVIDTGAGIEKNIMDRIFDPYFTTKEPDKGTGLGLSVVQGIVKSFNGDIHVNSEPGKGTEVHVYLPIMEIASDNGKPNLLNPIQGGTERILLVDDEEPIAKMEKMMLDRLGYQVTTRTGSLDALDIFKANPDNFDLIITDMTMPNMTGTQLASEIKAVRADIPIIICTGFSDRINEGTISEFNIQAFITKPVIKKEIAKIIRDVLDKPSD